MSAVCLQSVRRKPLNELTLMDQFALEIDVRMREFRAAANTARLTKGGLARDMQVSQVRYMHGRLHGCVFAFWGLFIHRGEYGEAEGMWTAAMNEADFLAGDYLSRGL
jgi:hypothetical protein